MDDYHLFCTKTGVSHASMPAHWCQYCGKRTKQAKEDVQEDTIILTASSSIRPGPDSTPRTPTSRLSLREGTADAPISLDDTPNTPRTAGVSVPLSQTQALSKVYLAPGLREVEHAHARNETTKARIQSVSGRPGYTINPEDKGPKAVPQYLTSHQAHTPKFSRKGLSFSAPKIKENQFLIDLKIVIVYYCRYLGTDTAVFQSFKTHHNAFFPVQDQPYESMDDVINLLLYEIQASRLPAFASTLTKYLAVAIHKQDGPTQLGRSAEHARSIQELLRSGYFTRDTKSSAYKVWVCFEKTELETEEDEEISLPVRTKLQREQEAKIKREKIEKRPRKTRTPKSSFIGKENETPKAKEYSAEMVKSARKRRIDEISSPEQQCSPGTRGFPEEMWGDEDEDAEPHISTSLCDNTGNETIGSMESAQNSDGAISGSSQSPASPPSPPPPTRDSDTGLPVPYGLRSRKQN